MFHTSERRNHRNAMIALIFLAGIAVAGYYLAPTGGENAGTTATPVAQDGSGTQSTTATTIATSVSDNAELQNSNTGESLESICLKHEGTVSKVSCQEARQLVLNNYEGNIASIDKAMLNTSGENGQSSAYAWAVIVNLETEIEFPFGKAGSLEIYVPFDEKTLSINKIMTGRISA